MERLAVGAPFPSERDPPSPGLRGRAQAAGATGQRATLESVDPIDEAWAKVEADWGSEEAHRRFVGVCVALDRLPEAGKRYRQVREGDPARSDEAARQIERLISFAAQQLQDTRVAPTTSAHKRTLTWVAFTVMLVLMGAGVWFVLRV